MLLSKKPPHATVETAPRPCSLCYTEQSLPLTQLSATQQEVCPVAVGDCPQAVAIMLLNKVFHSQASSICTSLLLKVSLCLPSCWVDPESLYHKVV